MGCAGGSNAEGLTEYSHTSTPSPNLWTAGKMHFVPGEQS
jgi:hypothetical protein